MSAKVMPNADDVACAIVAACNETGENPIACASRVTGIRARHYALHALIHAFPKMSRDRAASLVGCPGKAGLFYHNSHNQHFRKEPGSSGRRAKWWNEAAFDRVKASLVARISLPAPEPASPPIPQPKPSVPIRQPETPQAPRARPLPLGERAPGYERHAYHSSTGSSRMSSRTTLEQMLREAVENTAKMTPKS